jgi:Rod binding domain-containing protein
MTPIQPMTLPPSGRDTPHGRADGPPRADLRLKAAELEAVFLTEMLGHAGLGAPRGEFGGGIGEDQFASFLRAEQARAIVEAGGIGLTERLFRALSAASGEAGHGR